MIRKTLAVIGSPFGLGMSPFWQRSWKHRLARYCVTLLACYVGVVALLMLLENWLLYHPAGAGTWSPPPPQLHAVDLELSAEDGTPIHAWWCPPPGWSASQGAILYFHGNAGNLSHRGPTALEWQKELGTAVLIVDYAGYGRSGGKPTEAGCYAAADAAYAWLVHEEKVPADRILLVGSSLGGGVAVDLAIRRPHRAMVLISTFTSIPEMAQKIYFFLPARLLVRNRFDNLAKIAHCSRPVFFAHGTADDLIPIEHSERLFAAANEPKRFMTLPGHGHDESMPPELFAALKEFLLTNVPLK
jgi:fermentation-respiration switch protein FrsA (DUF1100 family)